MKLKKELRAVKEINDQEGKKRDDGHEEKGGGGGNMGYPTADKVYGGGADKMYEKADESPVGGGGGHGGHHPGMMGMHVQPMHQQQQ